MSDKKLCSHCGAELFTVGEETVGKHSNPELCIAVLNSKISMLEQLVARQTVVTVPTPPVYPYPQEPISYPYPPYTNSEPYTSSDRINARFDGDNSTGASR